MCKEDVRIKRQTKSHTVAVGMTQVVVTPALPANPDRVALSLWMSSAGPGTADFKIVAMAGNTTTSPAVCGISTAQPVARVTIEELGVLVQGDISLWMIGGGAVTAILTEVVLLGALKDL